MLKRYPVLSSVLLLGGAIGLFFWSRPVSAAPVASPAKYETCTPSRDGIGKVWMGREISHVMGHPGIGWLERTDREKEEAPSKAIALLELAPDAVLADSDIYVIPDVLCNAGGVTVSYFEWVQDIQQFLWSEQQVNQKLEELMLRAFQQVRTLARQKHLPMRTAALSLGVQASRGCQRTAVATRWRSALISLSPQSTA